MKTRNALKLATLSVSLSFRIVTYGDNQAGTFSKEVITVAKVFCDNQYGWALEEAIIRGNTNRVDKILRERGVADAINEVVAVGDGKWPECTLGCGTS